MIWRVLPVAVVAVLVLGVLALLGWCTADCIDNCRKEAPSWPAAACRKACMP